MLCVTEVGLRERKKRETRELIAQTARRLFRERGFDAVTVDEVARAAGVSRKTVFNYFPAKEDLFFSGLELFEAELVDAVRTRGAGESILAAFTRLVTERSGLLAAEGPGAGERLYTLNRVVADSPALMAREQRIHAAYTDALAGVIAEETRASADDIGPWIAANAMMGLHRALIAHVRRRILGGERDPARLARSMRAQAERALPLLERGVGGL
jgi:AcrR family transcriptional regulator